MSLETSKSRETLRRHASDWYAKLENDNSPGTKAEFERWRSDPANAAAFDRISSTNRTVGIYVWSAGYVPGSAKRLTRYRRRRRAYSFAFAASVLLAIIALVIARGNPLAVRETEAVMLKTKIGEIRQVTLTDGSMVTLDTSTRLEVDLNRSHRRAHLKYGRARFAVAAGSEPFTIDTGDAVVTTVQGIIDVEQQGEDSRVNVLAGTPLLQVSDGEGARQLTLEAHQGAIYRPQAPLQTYEPPAEPDWTKGMLQFAGTPLANAIALANRYSDQRIVLEGDIGALRVTGAFHAGDNAGLAKSLAAAFKLSVHQSADSNWHLRMREGRIDRN